jgi:hypothetical protein
MKHEVKCILEKPFDAVQIKQRPGQYGKMLDYVETSTVIERLNQAFDSDWSFEIISFEVRNDEAICLGKLTVPGNIVKAQFGSCRVSKDKETGEYVGVGDALKGSASDSLKKAASLLGVGLSLYQSVETGKTDSAITGKNESAPAQKNGNGNGNGNLITPKQKKYVLTLGRRTNLDSSQVNKLCIENYSAPLDELSKSDASDLIALLTA